MVFFVFALLGQTKDAYAQFYVSKKSCVAQNNPTPPPPPPGGTNTSQTPTCNEPTSFFDTDLSSTSWLWDFGDGGIASTRDPKYSYQAPGDYTVTLSKTDSLGVLTVVTKQITVGTPPTQPTFNKKVSADTTVCDGSTLTLNPYKLSLAGGDFDYLWFPGGETSKTIDVDTSGCYSVEVKDKITGCSVSANIKVTFCLQESSQSGGGEKWFFGDNGVIDFTVTGDSTVRDTLASSGETTFIPEITDPAFEPVASNGTHNLKTNEGTAMVYGPTGGLAFYSDGIKIYEGQGDTEILNQDGSPFLGTGGLASQGTLIIPKIGCIECPHQQYYIYTVDTTTKMLSYSVIDLRYNNKLGAVVEANVPVLYPVTERITGLRTSDDKAYVIYTHEPNSNIFNILIVDATGSRTVPQTIGSNQEGKDAYRGVIAISPSGRRLAQGVVINGKNFVEVFDIDPSDYSLTNPKLIDLNLPAPPNVYGITFSQNSDLVYVTTSGDPAKGEASSLIQLALFLDSPADISSGKEIISSSTTQTYGAIQLGPVNGSGAKYVYLSILGNKNIPYIQNPDVKGNAAVVGFTDFPGSANPGVPLQGTAKLGFPNVIAAAQQQDGEGLSASYDGNCFNSPTILSTQGVCSPLRNEVSWIFEDGSTQKGEQISYTFPKVGWNKFIMRVKIFNKSPLEGIIKSKEVNKLLETECETKDLEGTIYILSAPKINLAEKIYICVVEGENKLVGPAQTGGNSFTFNWQTSLGTTISKDSAYNFFAAQKYKLEVKNEYECATNAEIDVFAGCEPRLFVPEIFSPNQDGINDNFTLQYNHIIDFKLQIFNRWGEKVFETTKPDIKWDGSFKGKTFTNQLYPWVITYRSEYFPERGVINNKGAVVIVK